jgi:hypothetical protein
LKKFNFVALFSNSCIMAKFCTFWKLIFLTVNQLFLPGTAKRK